MWCSVHFVTFGSLVSMSSSHLCLEVWYRCSLQEHLILLWHFHDYPLVMYSNVTKYTTSTWGNAYHLYLLELQKAHMNLFDNYNRRLTCKLCFLMLHDYVYKSECRKCLVYILDYVLLCMILLKLGKLYEMLWSVPPRPNLQILDYVESFTNNFFWNESKGLRMLPSAAPILQVLTYISITV